jgi:hypothetical protein
VAPYQRVRLVECGWYCWACLHDAAGDGNGNAGRRDEMGLKQRVVLLVRRREEELGVCVSGSGREVLLRYSREADGDSD